MNNNNSFSENIKTIRKEYGLTQESLGKILNLSKGQISFYEKGVSLPSIDLVTKLTKYLNIPLEHIIEISNCSDFYFREVVTQEGIYMNHIPTNIGEESISGIAGLIKNPMF